MMSGVQGAGSAVWGQLQMQLAQRNAEQAEQRARALQSEARVAQGEADRAQERARELDSSSSQARSEADGARRNLSALSSLRDVDRGLGVMRAQIAEVLSPPAVFATSDRFSGGEVQLTGTLVDIKA